VPAPWRSFTTGGHGIAEQPSRAQEWRPSPAARYCSPVLAERSNMQDRPTLYLTPMHAAKDKLTELIANIRVALSHVRAVAEQLPQTNRWKTFVGYVVEKITHPLPSWHSPDRLALGG
jgi:hypothetical protein